MLSKKMGLLWASAVLFLTSMSWGTRDNPVGHPDNFGSSYDWRAVRLELIMGSSSNKTFPSGISWTRVLNEDGKLQDLEENGGTGDDGYVYMAYEKSTFLCGMNTSNDPVLLPITDIFIYNCNTSVGCYSPKDTLIRNGRLYYKQRVLSSKDFSVWNTPLNQNINNSTHNIYIYYTHDFLDGWAVTDIMATHRTEHGAPYLPNWGFPSFYAVRDDQGNQFANLNAVSGKYNYLHVKKDLMELSEKPEVVKSLYFKYNPWAIYDFKYAFSNATHFKFDNSYEDGNWIKIENNVIEPGNYKIYLKNNPLPSSYHYKSNYANYAPNVVGPFSMTVRRMTTEDFTVGENASIKINYYHSSPYYSGEKISVRWHDECLSPSQYSTSNTQIPSDVKFYYSQQRDGSYTQFDVGSKWFNAGTYYVKASKPGNKYCQDINIGPVQIDVVPSRIEFYNDGSLIKTIEGNYGDAVNYTPPTNLTREGYTFDGWPSIPTIIPTGVTKIYANWTKKTYGLYLYRNNPNSAPVYQTISSSSSCPEGTDNTSCYSNEFTSTYKYSVYKYDSTISYPKWYKTGYKHTGWVTSNGTSSQPTRMPASYLYLYAKWTPINYTMTFNTDGGSSVAPITQGYETSVTKPADPTKIGYTFMGWSPAIPSKMPYGNTSYKAQWNINTYYVSFYDGYSVGAMSSKPVTYGSSLSSITYPKTPTRTGYVFAGWDVASLPATMPANDIVVTAKWDIDYFNVTFADQLELVEPVNYVNGKLAYGTKLKLRVKKGYKIIVDYKLRWMKEGVIDYPVACEFDADGVCTVTVNRDGIIFVLYPTEDFGSIQITPTRSEAVVNYDTSVTSVITEPIEVDAVSNYKEYTPNFAEVVMLPFDIDLAYVRGGIFCKFLGMEKSGFNYTARLMFMSTELKANTPYLYVPIWTTMRFSLPKGEKVAIKTAETPEVRQGDWVFRGNYNEINWEDTEIENAYVFKGKDSDADGVNGSFVKATSGTLHSMSGYLIQEKQAASAVRGVNGKAAQKTMSIEELPDEIGIRIEYENGKTTALGTLNTRTGEMKIDRWFDVQGRLLKGKPTIKGVYYNNGKKIIVK